MGNSERPLLAVENLHVEFRTAAGRVRAINGVSFDLEAGETLCIVGESGSGKSVTGEAIMRILDMPPAHIAKGSIVYHGHDLLTLPEDEMNRIRGKKIAMVFQDALATLNPVLSVGNQIAELFRRHATMSRAQAREAAIEAMERVQIPAARERYDAYPHQFSGGMRQRIMIAMAIALDPEILIADEPTTALDVTVQAGIIQLLADLCAERRTGLIFVTHDLSVVANIADKAAVMYAGRIIEHAAVEDIFERPLHPYTRGLLASLPRAEHSQADLPAIPGSPPDPRAIPPGCPFNPRCPHARDVCTSAVPAIEFAGPGHSVACHFWREIESET